MRTAPVVQSHALGPAPGPIYTRAQGNAARGSHRFWTCYVRDHQGVRDLLGLVHQIIYEAACRLSEVDLLTPRMLGIDEHLSTSVPFFQVLPRCLDPLRAVDDYVR